MSAIKTIVLIVGHGAGDSGASGWNGMSEFNYNSFVAEEIAKANTGKQIEIVYRGASGIKGAAKKAMSYKADMTIEMHLNAFNKTAVGCVVLTLEDKISIEYGRKFSEAFCKRFNRKIRDVDGVKELKKNDRGNYSLALCNDPPPSILLESFFIDNPSEWIDPAIYADFLIEWVKTL